MEGLLIRGQNLILSGCGGTSTFARSETLAAYWLQEPQPISNQPMRLGFPTSAERYRPGESSFLSPVWCSCKDMAGFLIRGWELILPGCGGTLTLARGATLPARWLHEPQPISNQPVGLGCPHLAERYRPGGSASSSPVCWSCTGREGFFGPGMGTHPPRVRWDVDVGPRGNFRRGLAP